VLNTLRNSARELSAYNVGITKYRHLLAIETNGEVSSPFLEKDNNQILFCYLCQKLHDPYMTGSIAWIQPAKPCSIADRTTLIYGCYLFNYSRIYITMKSHRLGIDKGALFSSLSRTIYYNRLPKETRRGWVRMWRLVLRMIGRRLLMRVRRVDGVGFPW